MKITLYKSSLCPRCYLARKSLEQLIDAYPGLELECVDILASPRRALQAGIRMIPAIKAGERLLSGVYLGRNEIAAFLAEIHGNTNHNCDTPYCEKNTD